jgi:hypothetical protein
MAEAKTDTIPTVKLGENIAPAEMAVGKDGKNIPFTTRVVIEREGGKKAIELEVTSN